MEKKIIVIALILGMISIILGAFGAHALKKVLQPEQLTSFETGVRYQMYHALFLLFVANTNMIALKEKAIIFYLALIGVVLFSGSIYFLSTSTISGLKFRFLGPITPIGGFLLIGSWAYMVYSLLLKNNN
ncbi:DUF423 domain-containing protein [Flavobacterium okayamense]|uniref:Membrane protein n=1 Tax=Flavobacterium okayamense TaxID=2830782 RepID=A0ABM7SB35_9FLAO|nr:DUF423 domain-containing protein [Flavobacterium okayamense]BCY28042.1 membrane protein [Flavobacterium okayamense]